GDVGDDREPRAAVRATGERVPMPPVARVGDLGEAGRAGGGVGGDQGAGGPRPARDDAEHPLADRGEGLGRDPLDHRERRGLPGERVLERADRRGVALHLDEHPGRIVADQPAERQPGGERVRERAEPDALHHALDAEPGADGRHGRRVRSQAYQAARPWPRVAETGRTSRPGFTCVASAVQRPASKSTWGSRSTLVSSIRSAARNICGYLSGLSAPSVTDMITTFARSPRSNSAGQTRLPTFSIIT